MDRTTQLIRSALHRLAVFLFALALAAPAAAAAASGQPQHGGTAVIVLGSDPLTINPATTQSSPDLILGCMVYEALIEIRSDGTVVPSLAKSWTISPDALTYTFDLVEAKWQDGQPFTSADVAYSLREVNAKLSPTFSTAGNKIGKIETIGDHHVAVTLSEPYGPFLRMLSCANGGAIVAKHVFEGKDVASHQASTIAPVGTGPFKLAEWRRGDFIRVVKNPDYRQAGKPFLDGIIAKIIPNSASRIQALRAGEADFVQKYYLPTSDIAVIKNVKDLKLEPSSPTPNMLMGFFNVKKAPLSDVQVRRILFSVIDRKFIRGTAFFGQGLAATAPFPTEIKWAADPAIDYDTLYPRDPAKAREMLDALGLKPGADGYRFKLSLTYEVGIPERQDAAMAIQSAWRDIGVDVTLAPLERAVLTNRVFKEQNFDVFIHSYNSYSDPAIGLSRIYTTASIGTIFGNAAGYANPDVDALFAKAAALTTLEERGAVYRQIQQILARDLPVMALHEYSGVDAASAKLHGVWGYLGDGRWADAWLAQ